MVVLFVKELLATYLPHPRQPTARQHEQTLQEGDRVSMTPTKIEGAVYAA